MCRVRVRVRMRVTLVMLQATLAELRSTLAQLDGDGEGCVAQVCTIEMDDMYDMYGTYA